MSIKQTINPKFKDNSTIQSFIELLPSKFESEGTTLYAERNIIKSFTLDATDKILNNVIVKRYKQPSLIQRIIYSYFRKSKAERAFHNATKLRAKNIGTPLEIAYLEQWSNGLLQYGYYVSGCDDAPPIRERLIEPEDFDQTMARDFAAFVADLHEKGILHHDLNSTNVLYHEDYNMHYTFSVIDINRMDFFSNGEIIPRKTCFDNLTRFTGRMDLFEYVIRYYAETRNWDIESSVMEAVSIKNHHDEQWRKRKAFFNRFKAKKK
ncbi:lipopolysaccharide kinase InaA family protein [Dysgonomonas macrotermitis]|uniref:Lipopolysaccharide kinase (Kdo/WaaP) family protein n=1 Tax=Dysgonomonas macrotermitis TaxID=1346286 RepID=A0A1M5FU07_9BACT|nr:lipopolysaccharide kinase InaA family protein [Dysgonomonas macrotermitis]SHF95025.1 Lipopolysaccharide kinase (Kdo/WaaP) family protein [Dysgonomonas macrotermitis]